MGSLLASALQEPCGTDITPPHSLTESRSPSNSARRIATYDVIKEETGLSKNTLARLANDRTDLVALNTMDRVCAFFDCQPGDLFIYLPTAGPESAR